MPLEEDLVAVGRAPSTGTAMSSLIQAASMATTSPIRHQLGRGPSSLMPEAVWSAVEASFEVLAALEKRSFALMKGNAKPQELVLKTMCAVMTLLGKMPSWTQAKAEMADPAAFVERLRSFDKETVSDEVLRKLQRYTKDPNLAPEPVGKLSPLAGALCQWLRAVLAYVEETRRGKFGGGAPRRGVPHH